MQVFNKIIVDIATNSVLEQDSFEYTGPVAQLFSAGLSGQGSKQSSKQKSEQSSESGTRFNEDFLTKAMQFFGGGTKTPEERAALTQRQAEAKRLYDARVATGASLKDYDPETFRLGEELKKADFDLSAANTSGLSPTYDPNFIRSAFKPTTYTGAAYTPVEGGDFNRIEQNLFQGQKSRLSDTYNTAVARQNEEIAQMGGLTSPTRFLEGTGRTALDRGYLDSIQQAARDAATTSLGLKAAEAGRRTGFDVGEATRRTGYDVTEAGRETEFGRAEAGRETQFNEQTAAALIEAWFKKLAIAIESGRFTQGGGWSAGESSGISGGGSVKGSFLSGD